MTLILSGTDGLSDVDGSAATPAIRGTDANTGIFFPAADTIAFSEGGAESMRIDASGNLGLGVTPSAWSTGRTLQLGHVGNAFLFAASSAGSSTSYGVNAFFNSGWKYGDTGYATRYSQDSGAGSHLWFTAPSGTAGNAITFTEAMRIDSSGNVGIGTSSPFAKLSAEQAGGNLITARYNSSNPPTGVFIGGSSGAGFFGSNLNWSSGNTFNYAVSSYPTYWIGNPAGQAALIFGYGLGTAGTDALTSTERMRIDSSGNLLVGTTGAALSTNTFFKAGGASQPVLYLFKNSAANTDQAFCIANGVAGGTVSFQVLASGNAQNTNNSYGAISDAKLKENIVDATPKLEKLNQVRIVNFNMIGDEQKQIGVIAQELEQIFPGMVEESPDYEEVTTTDEDGNETTERVATGTTTKSVKYSVFVPMLIKAIQEQQALITTLTDRITALEAK
jgi:hypothetical protein